MRSHATPIPPAGHPFRKSLSLPAVMLLPVEPANGRAFLLTYVAGFVTVLAFIA